MKKHRHAKRSISRSSSQYSEGTEGTTSIQISIDNNIFMNKNMRRHAKLASMSPQKIENQKLF